MDEWKEYKFSELLEEPVRNGIYKKKEFHGRGTKIVNMGELFSYPRLIDTEMKLVELNENEKNKCLLRNGDLIFARRSLTAEGAGKCSLIHRITEDVTFESSIIRARPNQNKVSPEFLYYYFNSPYGSYLLGTILRQVAVSGITGTDLMDLILSIPDKDIQDNIAQIFRGLDDKIDLLNRQNKTLEQLAETLFKQWFVEEADESWEKVKLIKLGNIICGKTPSKKVREYFNGEIPFIKIPDMHGKTFVFEAEDSLTELGMNSQVNKTIPPKSICVSCIATVGLVVMNAKTAQTNQQINSIVPYEKHFRYFIYLKMLTMKDDLLAMASGGTATDNLNTGNFSNIDIQIAEEKLIINFHQTVKPIFNKIFQNQIQIRTLTQLRDTLLPKLMSGEVRVKC